MNASILLRSAAVQLAAVVVVSLILGLLLPKSFFQSWGWVSGPVAWMACAALTARVVGLDRARTLLGALLAGVPAAVAVVAGVHWLGVVLAVALFAIWCATETGQGTGGRVSSA